MMDTRFLKLKNDKINDKKVMIQAVELLRKGLTVAFPTETVYGLGADATNEMAVKRIFQAKGRPADNPLIAHVATKEQLMRLITELPTYVDQLIDSFSPGPITYILPSNGICAPNVTAGLPSIGVRMPDHPVAQALLINCDLPIAAPSANISGKPSPTTAEHVWHDLHGKIAGILDGGPTGVGVESTVLDCTQDIPIILRPGGITKEQLETVVEKVMMDPALIHKHEQPKSPGMKYKHYAPEIPLWLVEGAANTLQAMIDRERKNTKRIGVLASTGTAQLLSADKIIPLGQNLHDIAANLYGGLREFKAGEVDIIICEAFPEEEIGQAIMNRLKKAASLHIK